MAFTTKQMAIIERRLPVGRIEGDADRPIPISVNARELRFLLEAVDHYRDSRCAANGLGTDCELMYWYESAQGHIERSCEHFCEHLIDRLLTQIPERR